MAQDIKPLLQFFSSLADETRLKIVLGLLEKPRTVNEIHAHLGEEKISLSGVSHQLKLLSALNVVISQKRGREKTFRLSDKFCWCIIKDAFGHFKHTHCSACAKLKH